MAELLAIVTSESEALARFIVLLQDEQEALKSGNASVLPALTQDKASLIEAMNDLAGQRNARLAGCGKDKDGMSAWLRTHPADQALRNTWDTLLKQAEEARQLNQLNGQLIDLRLRTTQDALATLTQQARHTSVYGPNGQSAPLTGHRIIDSA